MNVKAILHGLPLKMTKYPHISPATLFITKNNLHKTRRKYYRLTGKSNTTPPPLILFHYWNVQTRMKDGILLKEKSTKWTILFDTKTWAVNRTSGKHGRWCTWEHQNLDYKSSKWRHRLPRNSYKNRIL